VLTGAGEKAFAAGADIKEMAEKPAADFYAKTSSPLDQPLVKATASRGSRRSTALRWAAAANWR
jgi:enoyl-CoA hydratase/carnithine racemase